MVNETNIRCFLMLAHTLNFTVTANELHFSQQSISKNIAKLEQDLNTKLFLRNHHTVELTYEGKQYVALFTSFYEQFHNLKKELQRNQGQDNIVLRVGYQEELDFGLIPYYTMTMMKNRYPDFVHKCERQSPQILMEQLQEEKLDLVVIYERFIPDFINLQKQYLCKLCEILMVSDHYPLDSQETTYMALNHEPLIFDSDEENSKNDEIKSRAQICMNRIGLTPSRLVIVANRSTAFSAAEQGSGFIVTTKFSNIAQKQHMRMFPTGFYEPLVAVWRHDCQNTLVEEYVAILKQQFEKTADGDIIQTV